MLGGCVTVSTATFPSSPDYNVKGPIGFSFWTVTEKNRYAVRTLAGSRSPLSNISVVVLLIDDILIIVVVDMHLNSLLNLIEFLMLTCNFRILS